MSALDEWTKEAIIEPLVWACGSNNQQRYDRAVHEVQLAVRTRVWESYNNGRHAPIAQAARQPQLS
jgi:hypothetical protein